MCLITFNSQQRQYTEDVTVMRGPQAKEWIQAVREEAESFKKLGVYEEMPRGSATSTPLPARLILVTKRTCQKESKDCNLRQLSGCASR